MCSVWFSKCHMTTVSIVLGHSPLFFMAFHIRVLGLESFSLSSYLTAYSCFMDVQMFSPRRSQALANLNCFPHTRTHQLSPFMWHRFKWCMIYLAVTEICLLCTPCCLKVQTHLLAIFTSVGPGMEPGRCRL